MEGSSFRGFLSVSLRVSFLSLVGRNRNWIEYHWSDFWDCM